MSMSSFMIPEIVTIFREGALYPNGADFSASGTYPPPRCAACGQDVDTRPHHPHAGHRTHSIFHPEMHHWSLHIPAVRARSTCNSAAPAPVATHNHGHGAFLLIAVSYANFIKPASGSGLCFDPCNAHGACHSPRQVL
jgi:hypothetical protein